MISASHNPHHDNGIKLFGPDGYKLDDEIEIAISELASGSIKLAEAGDLGRARRMLDSVGRYVEFAKTAFPDELRLNGMKLVVDCANGAAYRTAPDTLSDLGAAVVPLFNTPDGYNINNGCGAVHPQAMAEAVVANGAHLGIALDGDADRLIIADEKGRLVDGDQILATLATAMKAEGALEGDGVVGTVMSNRGLETYLGGLGLTLHRSRVGDRYILETMRQTGINLGGEPSGHVLMTSLSTSGDGLMAALQVLAVLQQSQRPASEVLDLYTPSPQKLENLTGMDPAILKDEAVQKDLAKIETALGDAGRVLVRPSGTEALIRVMVEADDEARLDATMAEIILRLKSASS